MGSQILIVFTIYCLIISIITECIWLAKVGLLERVWLYEISVLGLPFFWWTLLLDALCIIFILILIHWNWVGNWYTYIHCCLSVSARMWVCRLSKIMSVASSTLTTICSHRAPMSLWEEEQKHLNVTCTVTAIMFFQRTILWHESKDPQFYLPLWFSYCLSNVSII